MTSAAPRIAVDAMGGDRGPDEVIEGVRLAVGQLPVGSSVIVVGDLQQIEGKVASITSTGVKVSAAHASQVIGAADRPSEAFRGKSDASVSVAARLVKDGHADAFISIGNTGAAMAAALLHLRPISGIDRPAITAVLPTGGEPAVMLDMGATVDCEPHQLLEFAIMGIAYCRQVLGRRSPRVALLSNGEETGKGNEATKRAHKLMREFVPEFVGNIEASDAFRGGADVVVCDGFCGNVLLKGTEGVVEMVLAAMREELTRHPWMKAALLPLRPAMRRLRHRLDYRAFGGAPLLGVNGVCIIGHGRSDALAVSNAIRVGAASVGNDLVPEIRRAAEDLRARRSSARASGSA